MTSRFKSDWTDNGRLVGAQDSAESSFMPSTTIPERVAFHEPHLTRVSRSFAFGISRLQPKLQASVGLGYLVCRILDTIEDAKWESPGDQIDAFEHFDQFVISPPDETSVEKWLALFPTTINDGERLLLRDSFRVFSEFHSLSPAEREAMYRPIASMSAGMRHFTAQTRANGILRIRTLHEANQYCLFVAGVVGELLTGLLNIETPRETAEQIDVSNRKFLIDGCHFGLFLQKINILKDQWSDEAEGRFLVPNRQEMLSSLKIHASRALQYLISIPKERSDFRLFCAWALYLGLATIPYLEMAKPTDLKPAKLPRVQAMALGAKVELSIGNDSKLEKLFRSLVNKTDDSLKHNAAVEDSSLARSLYRGVLTDEELVQVLAPNF